MYYKLFFLMKNVLRHGREKLLNFTENRNMHDEEKLHLPQKEKYIQHKVNLQRVAYRLPNAAQGIFTLLASSDKAVTKIGIML